ncbi:MAG: hypothetical protein ACRDGQ_10500, partial [Candidatus Limnocylindrales bacterium]
IVTLTRAWASATFIAAQYAASEPPPPATTGTVLGPTGVAAEAGWPPPELVWAVAAAPEQAARLPRIAHNAAIRRNWMDISRSFFDTGEDGEIVRFADRNPIAAGSQFSLNHPPQSSAGDGLLSLETTGCRHCESLAGG